MYNRCNIWRRLSLPVVLFAAALQAEADNATYWSVVPDCVAIDYRASSGVPHADHLEMSGKRISAVLRYKVNDRSRFELEKSLVWPMLRTVPNNTHASFTRRLSVDIVPQLHLNEHVADETVETVRLDGRVVVSGTIADGVGLERSYFTSTTLPVFCERYTVTNRSAQSVRLEVPDICYTDVSPAPLGVDGEYVVVSRTNGAGHYTIEPGHSITFAVTTQARRINEPDIVVDITAEEAARINLVAQLTGSLNLETPDPILNRMFEFSKIRACESIFETKGGPMHGPGGESYYAAVWANDQAEYANPFFPYVGYAYADSSAVNSFRHFARWMNDEWRPIPSSIIAEGDDFWNGAGDRGDAAMIAYGASRFALACGDQECASSLWPLIEWCLEYCNRKLNSDGVVASDSDELEGRFSSGEANLCTSSLYYDALVSASYLAKELGKPSSVARQYRRQATELAKAIDIYFAGPVEGFDTYAYHKGNTLLRAWICIPLTMGIYDRADATVDALFSPRLWTENGLLTQAGTGIFWDRSTLYALRGVIAAGHVERALPFLKSYSARRLTGDHVPYAIEAWPEGDKRHLSAESALYARVFTEGLFGIRPIGLSSFDLAPQLPDEWDHMALRRVRAFGSEFDIEVSRIADGKLKVIVTQSGTSVFSRSIHPGQHVSVKLNRNR